MQVENGIINGGEKKMSFRIGITLAVYLFMSLVIASFILIVNDDSEGMGTRSAMSQVRSSQKGSLIQKIIWGLIPVVFGLCILLNKMYESKSIFRKLENTQSESVINTSQVPVNTDSIPSQVVNQLPQTETPTTEPINATTPDAGRKVNLTDSVFGAFK